MDLNADAIKEQIGAARGVFNEIQRATLLLDSLMKQRLSMETFSRAMDVDKLVSVRSGESLKRVGPLIRTGQYSSYNLTEIPFPQDRLGSVFAAIETANAVHAAIVKQAVDQEIEKIDREILAATKALHDAITSSWDRFSSKMGWPPSA